MVFFVAGRITITTVLDGKRIKGASTSSDLTHVVELFASESQITLYQERVPDKKNELAALAPILESVDVEGSLISMDAMFTQKANPTLIKGKKADYLMGLKGNQSSLFDEIQYYFEDAAQVNFESVEYDSYYYEESGHGRKEKRTVQVVCDLKEWLPQIEEWKGLKTAIEVTSERISKGKVDPSAGLAAARRFATHEPEYLKGMLVKLFGNAIKSF